jgi:hypothetical protein
MEMTFSGNVVFNSPLFTHTAGTVNSLRRMFNGAAAFNQAVSIDATSATTLKQMFTDADAFNAPVQFTSTASATDFSSMFA